MQKLTREYLNKVFQDLTKPTKDVYHICMGDREGYIRVDFGKETIQLLKSYMIVSPPPKGFTVESLQVYLDHFTPPLLTPLTYRHVVDNYKELMVPSPEGEDRYLKLIVGCTYFYIDLEKMIVVVARPKTLTHRIEATEEGLERVISEAPNTPSYKEYASKRFAQSLNYTVIENRRTKDFNILLEDFTIRVLYGKCIEVLDLENKLLYSRPPQEDWLVEVLNFHTRRYLRKEEVMRLYSDKITFKEADTTQLKVYNPENIACLISMDLRNAAKGIEVTREGSDKTYPLDAPFTEQSLRLLIQNLETGGDAQYLDWNAEGLVHPDKVKSLYPTIQHKVAGGRMDTLESAEGYELGFTLNSREMQIRIQPKKGYRKLSYTKSATMQDFKKWLEDYSLLEISQGIKPYPIPEEEDDLIEDDDQDLVEGTTDGDSNLTKEFLIQNFANFEEVATNVYEVRQSVYKDLVLTVDFGLQLIKYLSEDGWFRLYNLPFTREGLHKVYTKSHKNYSNLSKIDAKTAVLALSKYTLDLTTEYVNSAYSNFDLSGSPTTTKVLCKSESYIEVDFGKRLIISGYYGKPDTSCQSPKFTRATLAWAVRKAGLGAGTLLTKEWVEEKYTNHIKTSTGYDLENGVKVDFKNFQVYRGHTACEHFDRAALTSLLPLHIDLDLTEEYLIQAYPEFEKVKGWGRRYELYQGEHKDLLVRVDFPAKYIMAYAGKYGVLRSRPFTESNLEKVVKESKKRYMDLEAIIGIHPKTAIMKEEDESLPLTEEYLVANYPKFVKNVSHTAKKENWYRWSEGIKRVDVDFEHRAIYFRYWGGDMQMKVAKTFTEQELAWVVRLAGHGAGTQLTPQWVKDNYNILIKGKVESTYYLDNENVVVDFASRQIHKDGIACEHFDRESLVNMLPTHTSRKMEELTEKEIYAAPLTEANLNKYYPQFQLNLINGFYEYRTTGDRVRVQIGFNPIFVTYANYDLEEEWNNTRPTLEGVRVALENSDMYIKKESTESLKNQYTLEEFFPMQVIQVSDTVYKVFKDSKVSLFVNTKTEEVYDTKEVKDVPFTVGGLREALDNIQELDEAKSTGTITQEMLQSMKLHETIQDSDRDIFRVVGGWLYTECYKSNATTTFVPERVSNVVVRVGRDEEE